MKFQHPFVPIQVPACSRTMSRSIKAAASFTPRPGHGVDDFNSGQKYGLEIYAPLDDKGVYTEGLPEYRGKDRLHRESNHRETSRRSRRAARPSSLQAQLSALAGAATIP